MADLKLTDDARAAPAQPPAPLPGYHVAEITITENSPAAGRKLDDVSWPPASIAVSVLRVGSLYPAEQGITLAAGDRVSLLIPATLDSQPRNAERWGEDERYRAVHPRAGTVSPTGRHLSGRWQTAKTTVRSMEILLKYPERKVASPLRHPGPGGTFPLPALQ